MAWRYQCLLTLTYVFRVFYRSQPLSLQRWYTNTSLDAQYPYAITRGCYQSRDPCTSDSLGGMEDHERRPSTPTPLNRNPPRRVRNQSRSENVYRHNPQLIQPGAYWQFLDAHLSQCYAALGRVSVGQGTGLVWYHRLLSSLGITNVRSTCNSARYLVCGHCSSCIQFAAIHHWYDCCQECCAVSQICSQLLNILHRQGHHHGHWHWNWHWHEHQRQYWHSHRHLHWHRHRHRHRQWQLSGRVLGFQLDQCQCWPQIPARSSVACQQWKSLGALSKAALNEHVNARGRVYRLFGGLERRETVALTTERHSQQILTATANQLWQLGCCHNYHHRIHRSLTQTDQHLLSDQSRSV
jgi:hypothetical protein